MRTSTSPSAGTNSSAPELARFRAERGSPSGGPPPSWSPPRLGRHSVLVTTAVFVTTARDFNEAATNPRLLAAGRPDDADPAVLLRAADAGGDRRQLLRLRECLDRGDVHPEQLPRRLHLERHAAAV